MTEESVCVLLPLGLHRQLAGYRFPLAGNRDLTLRAVVVPDTDRVTFEVTSESLVLRGFKLRESWLDAGTRSRMSNAADGIIWSAPNETVAQHDRP